MTGRGKRKAKAPSPVRRPKRVSVTGLPSDASESEYAGQEDVGREDSEGMLAIAGIAKRFTKEDPFFEEMRDEIKADEHELQQLIDGKEMEMSDRNNSFNAHLRTLLTDTLTTSLHPARSTVRADKRRRVMTDDSELTSGSGDPRPGFDHCQLLFAKSDNLLRLYKNAETAVSNFEGAEEMEKKCDEEKAEVERLILVGEEIAKRKIQDVLQKPDVITKPRERSRSKGRVGSPGKEETKTLFSEQDVEEADAIFGALRERREDRGLEESDQLDAHERLVDRRPIVPFHPLLHDIGKGAKRMAKNLPV